MPAARSYDSTRVPDTKTIGSSCPNRSRSSRHTSYPEIPGSSTSRMTAAGRSEATAASASLPVAASRVSNPTRPSRLERSVRHAASSSRPGSSLRSFPQPQSTCRALPQIVASPPSVVPHHRGGYKGGDRTETAVVVGAALLRRRDRPRFATFWFRAYRSPHSLHLPVRDAKGIAAGVRPRQ